MKVFANLLFCLLIFSMISCRENANSSIMPDDEKNMVSSLEESKDTLDDLDKASEELEKQMTELDNALNELENN